MLSPRLLLFSRAAVENDLPPRNIALYGQTCHGLSGLAHFNQIFLQVVFIIFRFAQTKETKSWAAFLTARTKEIAKDFQVLSFRHNYSFNNYLRHVCMRCFSCSLHPVMCKHRSIIRLRNLIITIRTLQIIFFLNQQCWSCSCHTLHHQFGAYKRNGAHKGIILCGRPVCERIACPFTAAC